MARYQAHLSGPLLDRIDLHVEVPAPVPASSCSARRRGEATRDHRARAWPRARERQLARQGKANQALHGAEIDRHAALDPRRRQFLHAAAARLGWSARSTTA